MRAMSVVWFSKQSKMFRKLNLFPSSGKKMTRCLHSWMRYSRCIGVRKQIQFSNHSVFSEYHETDKIQKLINSKTNALHQRQIRLEQKKDRWV
jgi:hypothetical protein